MKTIEASREFTPKETYRMTKDPAISKMSLHKGKKFVVSEYLYYEDTNKSSGDSQTILSIMTDKGEVFATNSPTLQEDFRDLCSMYPDGHITDPVEIVSGTSKAGREFITVRLA